MKFFGWTSGYTLLTTKWIVATRTQGSWVPSLSISDWHGRVGFAIEELKLTTVFSIALMSNFNALVVIDVYYNKINSKKGDRRRSRCFSKWPLNRDFDWVFVSKESLEAADARTEIHRGLLHVIVNRTAFSLHLPWGVADILYVAPSLNKTYLLPSGLGGGGGRKSRPAGWKDPLDATEWMNFEELKVDTVDK